MGAFETMKGKAKELTGELTGNEALEQEGSAQVEKGVEQTKAAKARAEAQAHEKAADTHEARQTLAEKTS